MSAGMATGLEETANRKEIKMRKAQRKAAEDLIGAAQQMLKAVVNPSEPGTRCPLGWDVDKLRFAVQAAESEFPNETEGH